MPFTLFKRHLLTAEEAAGIIERFLSRKSLYPQEWNDFVDSKRGVHGVEEFRKRRDELDPLVNCPNPQDKEAIAELHTIAEKLRRLANERESQESTAI